MLTVRSRVFCRRVPENSISQLPNSNAQPTPNSQLPIIPKVGSCWGLEIGSWGGLALEFGSWELRSARFFAILSTLRYEHTNPSITWTIGNRRGTAY
jgi:hypothetical protein